MWVGRPSGRGSNHVWSGHEGSLGDRVGHVLGDVLWLVGGLERLHPNAGSDALHVLLLEVRLSVLFALREGDVERLGGEDSSIHLRHRLGRLFGRGEADESEALRARRVVLAISAFFASRLQVCVCHHFGRGDRAKLRKVLAKQVVGDRVVQVLHVQIDALVALDAFLLHPVEFVLQFRLSLRFFLRTADVNRLPVDLL